MHNFIIYAQYRSLPLLCMSSLVMVQGLQHFPA